METEISIVKLINIDEVCKITKKKRKSALKGRWVWLMDSKSVEHHFCEHKIFCAHAKKTILTWNSENKTRFSG